MAGGRYVVLAVGRGDRAWLHGLPGVEVVHCTDVDEALVRLGGSRPSSALVVDGPIDGAGPDLIPAARRVAVPVLTTRAGVPGTLVVSRTGGGLLAALGRWARPVPGNDDIPGLQGGHPDPAAAARKFDRPGRLIAVCGPGGTGVSSVAMALALGLGPLRSGLVLADFALRSGQALLHGIASPPSTVDDLAHATICGPLSADAAADFTLTPPGRPYRLVAGLRRPHQWSAVRPLAFDVTLAGLRSAFALVVADITGEFEGEHETGSLDVEERNHMARRTSGAADLVVVVGSAGPTGRRALDQTMAGLAAQGVGRERLLVVINRSSVADRPGAVTLPPWRSQHDPASWAGPVTQTVVDRIDRLDRLPPSERTDTQVAVPVLPGSIGHWGDGL